MNKMTPHLYEYDLKQPSQKENVIQVLCACFHFLQYVGINQSISKTITTHVYLKLLHHNHNWLPSLSFFKISLQKYFMFFSSVSKTLNRGMSFLHINSVKYESRNSLIPPFCCSPQPLYLSCILECLRTHKVTPVVDSQVTFIYIVIHPQQSDTMMLPGTILF